MPESAVALRDRFNVAVNAVETRWRQLAVPVERLTAKQISAYQKHEASAGWRLAVQFADRIRRLDIVVSSAFPFSPARIVLVDRPDFLTWPHVEKHGVLCLIPEHTTLSVDDPYGAVANLLEMAFDLIEGFARGDYHDEFRAELLSYWDNETTLRGRTMLSLIRPSEPTRIVRVWEGLQHIIIADSDDDLRPWLLNRYPPLRRTRLRIRDGVFVRLGQVPLPSEYPGTARDVYGLAAEAGAAELLDRVAREVPNRLLVAFGALTSNGPAVVATIVKRPAVARGCDPLVRGFRPSRVPEQVFKARFFGPAPAIKASVDRVDAEWIHGRGQDPRFMTLRRATVAILGCGSVGAPVAVALAQAGVGRLILVDQKALKGANVGRHPLGVSSVGDAKAPALASRLQADLPHLAVETHVSKAEALVLRPGDPLANVDLIVSAMGNWPAEALLDEWHTLHDRKFPIVYGWTEAHAAAGHAVTIAPRGSRLRDGLDATGLPWLFATQWSEETLKQEPACGATFEPYGPVELGFITSLVAEAALDCLIDLPEYSTHRIWLGRRTHLERTGGQWTAAIKKIAPSMLDGGVTIERPWTRDPAAKVRAA